MFFANYDLRSQSAKNREGREEDKRVRSGGFKAVSLRKEVIQPHLPVRLPCYDFTPLTRRTFGTALLKFRSGKRLRVPPTRVV